MQSPFRTLLSCLSMCSVLGACVDNSGGPPPAGTPTTFSPVFFSNGPFSCDAFRDDAWLLRSTDDPAALARCDVSAAEASALQDALDVLAPTDALVLVTTAVGGCVEGVNVMDVRLDGTTLRPWLLRVDTAYGRGDVPCTDDIGEAVDALHVSDVPDADAVEPAYGVFNPDLPGAPALPG